MHRFWPQFSGPVVQSIKPRRIMQVGAEPGANTRNILDYCQQTGAHADIVSPFPAGRESRDALDTYPDVHDFHESRDYEALSSLETPDILFLAGCYNWREVLDVLTRVFARARLEHAAEPVILAHNCSWPYARRDMYLDPDPLLPENRHPYSYKGMLPGQSDLTDKGLNGQFANALHEGGSQNGVLTAIEDFIASWPTGISLQILPFFNGLGIGVPEMRRAPELDALVKNFFSEEPMLDVVKQMEEQIMLAAAESQQREAILIRRTEALRRARDLLEAQSQKIAALEEEIARLQGQKA